MRFRSFDSLKLFCTVAEKMSFTAAGDTLTTATDIGVFGQQGSQLLSSIVISESIDPQSYLVQLPGATTDPGRAANFAGLDSSLARVINANFGPDATDGITEIEYNFQGIFAGGVFIFVNGLGVALLPNILGGPGAVNAGLIATQAITALDFPLAMAVSAIMMGTMLSLLYIGHRLFDLTKVLAPMN